MQKQVTKSIIVKGKPSDSFEVWSDFEKFPKFMKYIQSVTQTDENTFHWVMEMPGGAQLEWEAETTTMETDKRIGWSSKDVGDFKSSGQVTFTSLPEKEQTQVTVTMQFYTESEPIVEGAALDNFDQILEEDLRNFKAYVEGTQDRLPEA